jgi:DNA-binding MarR family transcriptional regulator
MPGTRDADLRVQADRLGMAVHRLSRGLQPFATESGTTMPQLLLLGLVWLRGPLRVTELAELIPCSQPAATVIVGRMEGRGWLSRRRDPRDRRATLVELTAAGREELHRFREARTEALLRRLQGLTPAQREALLAALPLLELLVEQEAAEAGLGLG